MALAACSAPRSDFGRPIPDAEAYPFASLFKRDPIPPFTDTERELRDRAWAFLDPEATITDSPYLPRTAEPIRVAEAGPAYADNLLKMPARSSEVRYERLKADIATDRQRIEPFFDVADRQAELDRVRQQSLAYISVLQPGERQHALARVADNRAIVAAVCAALLKRARIYRTALERLVVATPSETAVAVERTLLAFEAEIRALEGAAVSVRPARRMSAAR